MLIPPLSPVSAHAPNSVAARREKRSPDPPPSSPDEGSEGEGAPEQGADESETGESFQSLARAIHDAQVESGPCDDSAPLPEDSHDPQELCAYGEPC